MIIFTKYSNERRPELRIRTVITEEDGVRAVRKLPACREAISHVDGIFFYARELDEKFRGTRFCVDACSRDGDAAVFEYLEGPTLEEEFDRIYAKEGETALLAAFASFFEELDRTADTVFRPTPECDRIFGETALPGDLPASSPCDIDLVLNNIIVQGEKWRVIDYEWTYSFPVPLMFVKWRVLTYYLTGNSKRLHLDFDKYCREAGIPESLHMPFAAMERHFQAYVKGNDAAKRDLYAAISAGTVDVHRLAHDFSEGHILTVYTDDGSGFSEKKSRKIRIPEDGRVFGILPVGGLRAIRLDPTGGPCKLRIDEMKLDGAGVDASEFEGNGIRTGAAEIEFRTDDPHMELVLPEGAGKLSFAFTVRPLAAGAAKEAGENAGSMEVIARFDAMAARIRSLEEAGKAKDALITHQRALAEEIRGMRSEKALRKLFAMRGKEDPFREFNPKLESRPDGLCIEIDEQIECPKKEKIRGWCFDRAFSEITLTVTNVEGTKVPAQIERSTRPDVAKAFQLDPLGAYGFLVTIPEESFGNGSLVLVVSDLRGTWQKNISVETDMEQRVTDARTGRLAISLNRYAEYQEKRRAPRENSAVAAGADLLKEFRERFTLISCEGGRWTEDAASLLALRASREPSAVILYGDDDLLRADGTCSDPYFKPDFDRDLLTAWNYIGSCFAVRKDFAREMEIPYPKTRMEAWNYLLCAEEHLRRRMIAHVPEVLSHRTGRDLLSGKELDEARILVEQHFAREGISAETESDLAFRILRTSFPVKTEPLVSILIPNMDHASDLEKCVRSVEELGGWKNKEYIIIENNSRNEETFRLYEKLAGEIPNFRVVRFEGSFDFSAINNFGVSHAKGDYLFFLNNDTEFLSPGALRAMVTSCMRPGVGVVGARLFYPDDTIQHAGVIVGYGGIAGHCFVGYEREMGGYMRRIVSQCDLSAVTAAAMLVKKSAFAEAGGFSRELQIALNDIDLCLKIRWSGLRVVYEPAAQIRHYESKSRGYETGSEKEARFARESAIFRKKWESLLAKGDPFYNRNLTLKRPDFSLKDEDEW